MPHRTMLWNLERKLLRRLVLELFPTSPPRYLDFACGTGRILAHLTPFTKNAVGVDVSSSMLTVARRELPHVELIKADLTRDDRFGDRKFDLITAFRFFPNAEPELRADVFRVLVRHLSFKGVLIFNNHKNSGSLARRITIALGRIDLDKQMESDPYMSRQEVFKLAERTGLRITNEFPLGVLPFTDRHMLKPKVLLEGIELLLSQVGFVKPLAQNLIYLCRHV